MLKQTQTEIIKFMPAIFLTNIHQLCSFQGWIAKCGQILVTVELDRSYNA